MENKSFLSGRSVGLDLFRSLLIIIGVFGHSAQLIDNGTSWYYLSDKEYPILTKSLFEVIHTFRMEVFFVLSGVFAAMVIAKKGMNWFYSNRLTRVFIPFVSSFILVSPLIVAVSSFVNAQPITFNMLMHSYLNLNHLWFLFSLSIISFLTPFKLIFKISNFIKAKNALLFIVLIYFCSTVMFVLKYLLRKLGYESEIIPVTLRFAVFFYFGMLVYYKSECFEELSRKWLFSWLSIGIMSVAMIYIFYIIRLDSVSGLGRYFGTLVGGFYAIAISLKSVFFFKDFEMKNSTFISAIINSALIIYIFHFPLTFYFGWVFDPVISDKSPTTYVFAVGVASVIACYCLFVLVKRSNVISYLFGLKRKVKNPTPIRLGE